MSIKELLPVSLREDEKIKALIESIEPYLEKTLTDVRYTLILSRIDELPEPILDLLAWQFHIEGWELASSIDEKRNLIKSAIELHRYKGTKWAIKKVLEALNLSGDIKEWFEYGGEPYKFKVDLGIQDREITPELRDKLVALINEYKNERSWLEEIILAYLATGGILFTAGQLTETEVGADFQSELEWLASITVPFAISAIGEAEITAFMEAL